MTRQLLRQFLESALNRGTDVECFLGGAVFDGRPTVRWVVIRREGPAVVASRYEAFDPRDPEWLDLYAFQGIVGDGDEPVETARFETVDAALDHARSAWGADPARYTHQGGAQGDYEDHLRAMGES